MSFKLMVKKKAIIEGARDISEDKLLQMIKNKSLIEKYLGGKNIKKKIFVPNRLINIII